MVILEGIPTAYLLFLSSPLFRTVTQIRIIQIKLLTIFPVGNKPYIFVWKICNDNRTEWISIRSEIIRVITKSDDRAAGVRFVYHDLFITIFLSRVQARGLLVHHEYYNFRGKKNFSSSIVRFFGSFRLVKKLWTFHWKVADWLELTVVIKAILHYLLSNELVKASPAVISAALRYRQCSETVNPSTTDKAFEMKSIKLFLIFALCISVGKFQTSHFP